MKSQITFSILATLTLFFFQNCSTELASASYKIGSNRGNAMDPNKLEVGSAVWPRTDSTVSNPVPLSISRHALPLAIDFKVNPSYDENSTIMSWGTWLSTWHSNVDEVAPLDQPKYIYRLDLFKNKVIDLSSGQAVLTLSAKDATELVSLLGTSVLANAREFRNSANCAPGTAKEYATLETDYGLFDLGQGAPCAEIDLYKNDGSGSTAGLQQFLEDLEDKL